MNKVLLKLVKIKTMSSLEIAELTGKNHAHVLRDIRTMLNELYPDNPNLDGIDLNDVLIVLRGTNGQTSHILLDKSHTLTLITGYSIKIRKVIVDRWQYLEDQLEVIRSKEGTKKHQLEAMEALSHLLPDDLSNEELSYIKANTVVNKAVSTLFGFNKMMHKADMSADMLEVRDMVLDDYIKLYEVLEDNGIVKKVLYEKYQHNRLDKRA